MDTLIDEIRKIQKKNIDAALCTIVESKGSTPRKVGSKMIVYLNGEIAGSIGGGNLEKKVIDNAKKQIDLNSPKLFVHSLLHHHNMCCGGQVSIFIEPIMKRNKLYIFGAGHTGNALAYHASKIDFDIFVIDNRKEYLDQINIDKVSKLHTDHKEALPSLPFDKNTYVAIMTYDHQFDRDILLHCIKQPYAYLGMIGSKRKVEITKKMFLESDLINQKDLEKVDMPMGLDINAESPHEIAISILSKLIAVKQELTKE
jgi:xanthine dehydrogenase accessory factor